MAIPDNAMGGSIATFARYPLNANGALLFTTRRPHPYTIELKWDGKMDAGKLVAFFHHVATAVCPAPRFLFRSHALNEETMSEPVTIGARTISSASQTLRGRRYFELKAFSDLPHNPATDTPILSVRADLEKATISVFMPAKDFAATETKIAELIQGTNSPGARYQASAVGLQLERVRADIATLG